ncbi:MAG: Ig-like domain-containing protein [Oscillospiraceae bacterium]|nr:Ig-like domain-containing protein [Oscillospiraceae bacterium]
MNKRIRSLLLMMTLALSLLGSGFPTAQAASAVAGNGRAYYIMVNRTMNTVTVYGLDANGYYTVPVKAMVCSVGRSGSVTPRGTFSVGSKRAWCHMVDGSYGQYATQFYGNYLFHSVCYSAADPSTLLTYEYNMLGSPASLGCVRLQTSDAKWIYDNCAAGTKVTVYDDASSPGPLGKPDKLIPEITPAVDNGWDPTDPRENNPWRGVLVSEVSLSTAETSLTVGERLQLTAALTPSTATLPQAVWSSSDPSVASVDAAGQVTGLKPGAAVITVSCGSVSDSCTVKVDKAPLPFTDVIPGMWYYPDIRYIYEAGVMSGTSGAAFSPEISVTCAMAEQDLSRLAEVEGVEKPSVLSAAGAKPDPEQPLTRQQFAVMLYQYETLWCGRPADGFAPLSQFADGKTVGGDAVKAVSWAVGNRLIRGTAQNILDPTAPVSRAQEAAILHRYLLYRQSVLGG